MHSGFGSESREFNRFQSDLVWRWMPSVDSQKACFMSVAKKDCKQCRGKDTALLHATKDVEGVGSGTIVQNGSLHVIMK